MSGSFERKQIAQKARISANASKQISQRYSFDNPDGSITIKIPSYFGIFDNDTVVFERCLKIFDWSIRDRFVVIDFSECRTAGHQAITLLVLYLMHLKNQGCTGDIVFTRDRRGDFSDVRKLWPHLNANMWPVILTDQTAYFRSRDDHPLYAIRDYDDFNVTLEKFGAHIHHYDMDYSKTLRHVVSELIYNAIEHGRTVMTGVDATATAPALMSYYHAKKTNEINIIIADLGIGIRQHLKSFIEAAK